MSIGGQSDAKAERKTYHLTPEGFARKHERLEYLRTVKRKEVADYIHEAKEVAFNGRGYDTGYAWHRRGTKSGSHWDASDCRN